MAEYIVYDFETTGLCVLSDRAVEVAAVLVKDGKVVKTFESLINSGKESSPDAYAVHGIGLKELKSAPKSKDVFRDFVEFIKGHYIVAHNGNNFDHYILRTELLRHGLEMPECKLIDSLVLANSVKKGPNKLADLCSHFKIKNSQSHRAMSDTKALASIFELLSDKKVDLKKCHEISKGHELKSFFPDILGFQLLLKSIENNKRVEIDYLNQKQELKRRWIVPLRTQINFGSSALTIVATCCEDNIEKNFRLERLGKVHSREE